MELRQEDASALLKKWQNILEKQRIELNMTEQNDYNPYTFTLKVLKAIAKNNESHIAGNTPQISLKFVEQNFRNDINRIGQAKMQILENFFTQLKQMTQGARSDSSQALSDDSRTHKVQPMSQLVDLTNTQSTGYEIFEAVKTQLQADPDKKIALIFSANDDQVRMFQGNPFPTISGAGQAEIFKQIIELMKAEEAEEEEEEEETDIKSRFQILPFATSLHGGNNTITNSVGVTEIVRDLNSIQNALNKNYEVFCLTRQNKDNDTEFSIGGGVSANWINKSCYQVRHYDSGKTESQNDFVQNYLNTHVTPVIR